MIRCPKLAQDVKIDEKNDSMILFSASTGTLLKIPKIGKQILDLCNGKNDLDFIVKNSKGIGGIDNFLEELKGRGFIIECQQSSMDETQGGLGRFFDYPPFLDPIDPKPIWENKRINQNNRKIGFYIHIPFCEKICYFCPYNKYIRSPPFYEKYIEALKKEIELILEKSELKNLEISAFFIGGGTPSVLKKEQLEDILRFCLDNLNFDKNCEITMEGNPNSFTKEKLEVVYNEGVNRISFGVQSFKPNFLKLLGVSHKVSEIFESVENAKNVGFDNISIDLLYRIPGQELKDWKEDLEEFVNLDIDHLSTYALDITRDTVLFHRKINNKLPSIPDIDSERELFLYANNFLKEHAFERYYIDGFCRKNRKGKYGILNTTKDVIGIGTGAFSHFNNFVYINEKMVENYVKILEKNRLPITLGKKLSKEQEMRRYMFKKSIYFEFSKVDFKNRFGLEIEDIFKKEIKHLRKKRFIRINKNNISVTEKGKLYIYNVSKAFYDDEYKEMFGIQVESPIKT